MMPPSRVRASTGAPSLSGGVTISQARLSGSARGVTGLGVVIVCSAPSLVAEGVGGDDAVVVGGVRRQAGELEGLGDGFFA